MTSHILFDNVSLPKSDRGIWVWSASVKDTRPAPHWFSRVKSPQTHLYLIFALFIGKALNYSVISLKSFNILIIIIIITSTTRFKLTFPCQ